jgi:hypothetical protein
MNERPLSEEERRYVGALKLFLEASGDPKHLEAAKTLDEFSPDAQRQMISMYHFALDDPQAFILARKIHRLLSPLLSAWRSIIRLFKRP